MAHLFECLTLWLAPYLCFTAEESWSHRPDGVFEDTESIHLRNFPVLPAEWRNEKLSLRWKRIREVRSRVTGDLEHRRADKEIGSSLEARITIDLPLEDKALFTGVDMAEICIVSSALLSFPSGEKSGGSFIGAESAKGCKCARCWKTLPEVGQDKEHDTLCNRCADAVRWILKNKKAA